MDNKELEQMMTDETDRQEMDERVDAPVDEEITKEDIFDIESNIRDKELEKMLDSSNLDKNSSKEDKEHGARGL